LFLGIFVFGGLIAVGALKTGGAFLGLVLLLGISTGLSAAGMLTAVIEFTTPARAGLLMGVWGVAHELGQAFGNLMSGVVVDLARALTGGRALIAYGVVFALEAALLVLGLGLLKRVDIRRSVALSGIEPISQKG
jgi:BCD family chlorophyll transporter-like MFS transporter